MKRYHCCACSPIVFFFFSSASCWLLSHPSLWDLFLFCTCLVCYHHMVVRISVALLCLQTTVLCHIFAAHPVLPSDTYHLFNTLDAKNTQISLFFFSNACMRKTVSECCFDKHCSNVISCYVEPGPLPLNCPKFLPGASWLKGCIPALRIFFFFLPCVHCTVCSRRSGV